MIKSSSARERFNRKKMHDADPALRAADKERRVFVATERQFKRMISNAWILYSLELLLSLYSDLRSSTESNLSLR